MANTKTEPTKLYEIVQMLTPEQLHTSKYQGRFPLADTTNPETPDATEKAMAELTRSIAQTGLMQPILVRQQPEGEGYEILDGHRRLEACLRLHLKQIPAIVKDCSERQAQIMSVVANLQRKNLNTIELAVTYQKLLDTGVFLDKKELSQAIGKDETYVGDLLLTLKMESRIVEDLASRNTIKDIRILRMIRRAVRVDKQGQSDAQWELYRRIVDEKLSRPQLTKLLKGMKKSSQATDKQASFADRLAVRKSAKTITLRIDISGMKKRQKDEILKILKEDVTTILEPVRVQLNEPQTEEITTTQNQP